VAASELLVGRRDVASVRFGHPVGSPVGDEQQPGDQQERSQYEQHLVPAALMCEDHPDDRTFWGNISRAQAV